MAELRLTVLMENTAPGGLIPEHGLAFYLEYRGGHYLLDAGESGAFLVNAERLGIDLSAVDLAFLSHGHYDHADGLAAFFAVNAAAPVCARSHAAAPCYHDGRYIGVKHGLFQRRAKRFTYSDAPRLAAPGLWTVPDQVLHEQSLAAETEAGLVLLNSCCHAGADHVVESVLAQFPGRRVRALIGGFHLMGAGGVGTLGPAPETVLCLGSRLFDGLQVAEAWTGHCTGAPALSLLRGAFPGRVHPLTTGLTLEF